MALRSLDHVNISCADLDRSRAFYADVLGLHDGKRPAFSVPGAWLYLGERPVVHLVGEARGGDDTGSFDHVAFEAEDFDGVSAHLARLNVTHETSNVPGAPVRQIFLLDPDGVKIELNFRG